MPQQFKQYKLISTWGLQQCPPFQLLHQLFTKQAIMFWMLSWWITTAVCDACGFCKHTCKDEWTDCTMRNPVTSTQNSQGLQCNARSCQFLVYVPKDLNPHNQMLSLATVPVLEKLITSMMIVIPWFHWVTHQAAPVVMIIAAVTAVITLPMTTMARALLCPKVNKILLASLFLQLAKHAHDDKPVSDRPAVPLWGRAYQWKVTITPFFV